MVVCPGAWALFLLPLPVSLPFWDLLRITFISSRSSCWERKEIDGTYICGPKCASEPSIQQFVPLPQEWKYLFQVVPAASFHGLITGGILLTTLLHWGVLLRIIRACSLCGRTQIAGWKSLQKSEELGICTQLCSLTVWIWEPHWTLFTPSSLICVDGFQACSSSKGRLFSLRPIHARYMYRKSPLNQWSMQFANWEKSLKERSNLKKETC